MNYQYSVAETAIMTGDDRLDPMRFSAEERVDHGVGFFERNHLAWFEIDLGLLNMENCVACMAVQLVGDYKTFLVDVQDDFPQHWFFYQTYRLAYYLGLTVADKKDFPPLQAGWERRIQARREKETAQ